MLPIDTLLAPVPQAAAFAPTPQTAVAGTSGHDMITVEGTASAPVPSLPHAEQNRLASVDGLGITCIITLGGMVAMGWSDAMLPSGLVLVAVAIRAAVGAGLATRTRIAAGLGRG
jgi:hypothetical protein